MWVHGELYGRSSFEFDHFWIANALHVGFGMSSLTSSVARLVSYRRGLVEQGRYSPSLEMAFKIARVFGVPLEAVFRYPVDTS